MRRGPGTGGGGVVARGRIRVDAGRAVAKLREHLLVDLHAYALEVVRAAVLAGASAIDVHDDADDVAIAFDGDPVPTGTLPSLLDHVLIGATSREERRTRLLALAVNAALGLDPAFVDVYASHGPSGCARVRFTPALFDEAAPSPGGAPARRRPFASGGARDVEKRLDAEAVARPAGMPARGMRVHVRRKMGWDVLRRSTLGGTMPEIAALAAATHDLAIPLRRGGAPLVRPPLPRALVRAPFDVRASGVRRAFVEILDKSGPPPTIELLELGVPLSRIAFATEPLLPSERCGRDVLPVRVVIDADELPTNASRSAVREDAALLRSAREGALLALADALRALIGAVHGPSAAPSANDAAYRGAEVLTDDRAALHDALAGIAGVVAGAARRGAALSDEARALLDLPLLRDAIGRARSHAEIGTTSAKRLWVWSGPEPLSADLAPWLGHAVWRRGAPGEGVLDAVEAIDAAELVGEARAGAERRGRLLAHPPGRPEVPAAPGQVAREAFVVEDGERAGLEGEVAVVWGPLGRRRAATVRVLVEQRIFEAIELSPAVAPIPFDAALAWEGRLRPTIGYDAVERNDDFETAIAHVTVVAALAVAGLAKAAAPSRIGPLLPLIRAATGAYAEASARLGAESGAAAMDTAGSPDRAATSSTTLKAANEAPLSSPEPDDATADATEEAAPPATPVLSIDGLADVPAWPTTERDRVATLRQLDAWARAHRAICVAPEGKEGVAPDGRPVVALPARELAWLATALDARLVPYEAGLAQPGVGHDDAARIAAARAALDAAIPGEVRSPHDEATQSFARGRARGAIAVCAGASSIVRMHAGRRLDARPASALLGPVTMAIDDDRTIPSPGWDGAIAAPREPWLNDLQRDLCEAVTASLEWDPEAAARVDAVLRAYLVRSTHALGARAARRANAKPRGAAAGIAAREADLLARIEALRLVPVLDREGRLDHVSLASVAKRHAAPSIIPALREPPGFETLDWDPVVLATEIEREALYEWSEGRVRDATPEVPERRRRAESEREARAFLARPEEDARVPGPSADPASVVIAGAIPEGITVAAGLPRVRAAHASAEVEVLFRGRLLLARTVARPAVPIVARIGLSHPLHVEKHATLTPAGELAVEHAIASSARALALAILREAAGPSGSSRLFGDARALAVVAAALTVAPPLEASPLVSALRDPKLGWPTVQGDERPFAELAGDASTRWIGRERRVPWLPAERRPSDLDRPILHVPAGAEGEPLEALLRAMGVAPRDETAAIAELQAKRARAGPHAAPRLAGSPAHPLLRTSLEALGVASAEGEVEIIAGPRSAIDVAGLGGAFRSIEAQPAVPIRMVARIDAADIDGIAAGLVGEVGAACARRLDELAPRLDELPAFVRSHLRALLCRKLARGGAASPSEASLPLFEDLAGAVRSFDEIRRARRTVWDYTELEPPYPKRSYPNPVLRLGPEEASALGRLVKLRSVSDIVRQDLAAEARASAPRVETIALGAEVRKKCIATTTFEAATTRGEVGLLAPAYADARGIHVHLDGRPLCRIDDAPGWPVVAVVDDARLAPDRWWLGIEQRADERLVRGRVQKASAALSREHLAPPGDALATCWLEGDAATFDGAHVVASIWLPPAVPEQPAVVALTPSSPSPIEGEPRTLRVPSPARGLEGSLPVAGRLLLCPGDSGAWMPEAAFDAVARAVLARLPALLEEADRSGASPSVLAAYRTSARLVGAEVDAPPVPLSGGGSMGLDRLLAEIASGRPLWVSSGRGAVLGEFPDGEPPFFLLDGSPAVRVLRARLPRERLRDLGGLASSMPEPSRARKEPAAAKALAKATSQSSAEGARPAGDVGSGPAPTEPSSHDGEAAYVPEPWIGSLFRRVAALFGSRDAPPEPAHRGLRRALLDAVDAMSLAGQPVSAVAYARSGRPVRFDPKHARLVVNRHHPAVARLVRDLDPGGIALLAAAALAEVSRASEPVTDAEERRALLALLRQGLAAR